MEERFRHEEQPLLCDLNMSDEESIVCSSERHRAGARGRAANKMKGVATIMDKWPDLLSSSMYTCWMTLLLMIFVFMTMYLVIMALSTTTSQYRFGRGVGNPRTQPLGMNQINKTDQIKVFCPIIKNHKDNFNLSLYTAHLIPLKRKFPQYQFKLIVLVNDTKLIAKENNIKAMNNLLKRENVLKKINAKDEISIENVLLSNYMDQSPVKHIWGTLNRVLMTFLVQAVALWESNGISFDLNHYVKQNNDKFKHEIEYVLRQFSKENETTEISVYTTPIYVGTDKSGTPENNLKHHNMKQYRKPFNNIRDIIEDLESKEFNDPLQEIIKSEETKTHSTVIISTTKSPPIKPVPPVGIKREETDAVKNGNLNFTTNNEINANNSKKGNNGTILKYDSLIPKLLKILFTSEEKFMRSNRHEANTNLTIGSIFDVFPLPKLNKTEVSTQQNQQTHSSKERYFKELNVDVVTFGTEQRGKNHQSVETKQRVQESILDALNIGDNNNLSPKNVNEKIEFTVHPDDKGKSMLILDIHGKLIATKVPCHAFISQIFATINKDPILQSPAKLIDKALKVFCHANPSSNCTGIKLLI